MNANRAGAVLRIGFVLLCQAVGLSAHATVFPGFPEDPLWAAPDLLTEGARLPDDSMLPCPAQVDFAQTLTLGDALDVALCKHPQVKAAWAQIKLETAGVGVARAAYLPTINGSLSRLQNSTSYPSALDIPTARTIGNQAYGAFNWRLFDFGGRAANRESANQLLLAAMAGHDAALQQVMAKVIQAFFDAVSGKALYEARRQMVQLAETTLNTTLRREAKGAATLGDSLQASTALARAGLLEARAGGDYQKALSVLRQSMGVAATTRLEVSEPDAVYPAGDLKVLDNWLLEAEERHPAIKQAKAKWASDQAKVGAAYSEGLPTLEGIAYVSRNGYPNQGLSGLQQTLVAAGLTVNFPIFEGFGRSYKIRSAYAQAEMSEAQIVETRNQIFTEVVKAHADTITSLGTLSASEKLLNSAREAMQSSQRRYAKNAADILEVLNAESALADAQQERIRAIADYRSARLRLLANSGVLGRISTAE